MSNYSEIPNYFPSPLNVHTRRRECFAGYGTTWAVDARIKHDCEDNQTKMKFFCQKILKCTDSDLVLAADGPSLPILPPNPYIDLSNEPCMKAINKEQQNANGLMKRLVDINSKAKNKIFCDVAKHFLCQVDRIKSSEDEKFIETALDKLFSEISQPDFKTIKDFVKIGKDWLGKHLDKKQLVNSSYAGGCISYQSCSSHIRDADGVLAYPSGDQLTELRFSCLSTDKHQPNLLGASCKFQLNYPIFQMDSTFVQNQLIFISRQANRCSLWDLNPSYEDSFARPLISNEWSDDEMPTSVCLSFYIPNESLISTNTGNIYLWSVNSRPKIVHTIADQDSSDHWNSCHFGAHPRLVVVSDRKKSSLIDLRKSGISTDLFVLPHLSLHENERIMATKKHPQSFYHVFATDYSVALMDERFPNHTVLHWNHCLMTPPQYLSTASDILPSSNDELILVGSQDFAETHCFQLHMQSVVTMPVACGAPWRVSKTDDFAMLAASHGQGLFQSMIEDRLRVPLVGIAAVPKVNRNGVAILQMTSFGDLFCQDYRPEHRLTMKDKTCCAGPGSDNLTLLSKDLAYARQWLEMAYNQGRERLLPQCNALGHDASRIFHKVHRVMDPHPGCSVCSTSDNKTSSLYSLNNQALSDVCSSCAQTLSDGRAFMNAVQHHSIMPQSDANVEILDCLDEILAPVDVNAFTDTDSHLLEKLWRNDPDIKDLIEKRDQEIQRNLEDMLGQNESQNSGQCSNLSPESDFSLRSPSAKRQRLELHETNGREEELNRSFTPMRQVASKSYISDTPVLPKSPRTVELRSVCGASHSPVHIPVNQLPSQSTYSSPRGVTDSFPTSSSINEDTFCANLESLSSQSFHAAKVNHLEKPKRKTYVVGF